MEKFIYIPDKKKPVCTAGKKIERIKVYCAKMPILNTTLAPDLQIDSKYRILLISAFRDSLITLIIRVM